MTSTAGIACPTVAEALSIARPLSAEMLTLLERGDVEGRYQSRSEAVMATAVAAVNAGWDEETWRHVLRDGPLNHWADTQIRKTGARRSRRGHDTERRLHTTWASAVDWVTRRPPARDHPSVMAELAAIKATADSNPKLWKGAAGVTDHAVLSALIDIGATACTLTPSASTRQIAEAVNISPATASVSLRRLQHNRWVRREHASEGVKAAIWRLTRPEDVPAAEPQTQEILEDLPPQSIHLVAGSSRNHDAFAHTIHGGLGRVAARIFDVLGDGVSTNLTVPQIAALTGLHKRTVIRHLLTLQSAGLVAGAGVGHSRTWSPSVTTVDDASRVDALDTAADTLGSAGTGAARRERHQAQRAAFITWRTDFDARRGWAVQRGLYRPDAPQLPLQYAA